MPASTLPSAGVLATCVSSKPCMRPRKWSGVEAKRIVERRIALISSAQPAIASIASAVQSAVAKPKIAIAVPQTTIASATATPWRRTWPIQPEVSAARSAPADGAA